MTLESPYLDGGSVRVPVMLTLLDPLDRIRQTGLRSWTGNPGKPRLASEIEPQPVAGDSAPKLLVLDHKKEKGLARGELVLPALPAGKQHWIQPLFVDGAGKQKWMGASGRVLPPPVERAPVVLHYKQPVGGRFTVDLVSNATLQLRDIEGQDHTLTLDLGAQVTETAEDLVDTDDNVTLQVGYRKFSIGIKVDNEAIPRSKALQEFADEMRRMRGELRVDPRGNVVLSRVPEKNKYPGRLQDLYELHLQILQSLQAISVPLPGKEVAAMKPWQAKRELWIGLLGPSEKGVADMTYTYIGKRKNTGRDEALINLVGSLRGVKGQGANMAGRITGLAIVEPSTGHVLSADLAIDIDMDTQLNGKGAKTSGKLNILLQRNAVKPDSD
jgi:hypothetical protein